MDFVVDTYQEMSIKGAERSQRAAAGGLIWTIVRGSQQCPSQFIFFFFLSVGANKTALIKFLLTEWATKLSVYTPLLRNRCLYNW